MHHQPRTYRHLNKKNEKILFIMMGIIFLGLIISGYFIFYDKIYKIIFESLGINNEHSINKNRSANQNKPLEIHEKQPQIHNSQTLFENELETQVVTLYFPSKKEPILIRELRKVKAEKYLINQVETLLRELMNGPFSTQAYNPFPKDLQLRGIYFNEGIFYIDFSKELLEKGGNSIIDYYLTFYSIVNTITELDKKTKVKILIQGEELNQVYNINNIYFTRNEELISLTN